MHGKTLGSVTTTKGVDSTVKDSIVLVLWDCLHEHNRFVQHCKIIGEAVKIVNDQNYPDEDYEWAEYFNLQYRMGRNKRPTVLWTNSF